jgi:hypothetical protein
MMTNMQKAGVMCAGHSVGDSFITFFLYSFFLLLCFFSLFFKTFTSFLFFKACLLFYSLKSWSLDSHCPMFSPISGIAPEVLVLRLADTQQQPPPASSTVITPCKQPSPWYPSGSLLCTVANREVEQHFWRRMAL